MKSLDTPNVLSRRSWLRDSAIAATGVVLPWVLTGCDHREDIGKGGLGSALTTVQLKAAAQNLLHMNAWIEDVYLYTGNYEKYVLTLLKSGKKPTDWKDFILNVLTDIAVGIIEAAAVVTEVELPFVGPAFAIAGEFIRQWAFGNRPPNLEAVFAEFELGHLQMQKAISDKLLTLADETDNYKNLREGWPGDIDFNGKKYTLLDLANSQFPTVAQGTAFVALRTAAYERFRKYIWNVMMMKAGQMNYYHFSSPAPYNLPCVTDYAISTFYNDPGYAGGYIRGYYWDIVAAGYVFDWWIFEFDGRQLSAEAAKELFIDDTPGHIMNPDDKGKPKTGLWPRDYVYKQFHTEKPDFRGYYDLAQKDSTGSKGCYGYSAFDKSTYDYVFTGGDFPQLVKK